MNEKLLLSTYYKYLKVAIADMPNAENSDFGYLLQYIGKNNPWVHKRRITQNPVHASIGNAYDIIKRDTNALLGIGRIALTPNQIRLKTSKKEISRIRYFYKSKKDGMYAKIPYKVLFIFTAIANILEEMSCRADIPPIPPNLASCVKKTYAIAFYGHQIQAYESAKRGGEFGVDEAVKWELENDFISPDSPFRIVFGE